MEHLVDIYFALGENCLLHTLAVSRRHFCGTEKHVVISKKKGIFQPRQTDRHSESCGFVAFVRIRAPFVDFQGEYIFFLDFATAAAHQCLPV